MLLAVEGNSVICNIVSAENCYNSCLLRNQPSANRAPSSVTDREIQGIHMEEQ